MIEQHTLENGLVLACEHISSASSTAISLRIPAGSARDTDAQDGCAALMHEFINRGVKNMNARDLCDAMDLAGMRRGGSVGTQTMHFHACVTNDRLVDALSLLFAVVISPTFPQAELEPSRLLCLQAIDRLSDEPAQETGLLLRAQHMRRPLHRTGLGTRQGIANVGRNAIIDRWKAFFRPQGSVLAIAGGVSAKDMHEAVRHASETWRGYVEPLTLGEEGPRGVTAIQREASQVHVAMAWDAPPLQSKDANAARLASACLGGTTSGRLFTTIRQQRSLCYSIGVSYQATGLAGWCQLHAGTTAENAQELIRESIVEIRRIGTDLANDEIERARKSIISSMVIGGESTSNRAGRMSRDMSEIGTCQTLAQRVHDLEHTSSQHVRDYVQGHITAVPTVVTVGPLSQEDLNQAIG